MVAADLRRLVQEGSEEAAGMASGFVGWVCFCILVFVFLVFGPYTLV